MENRKKLIIDMTPEGEFLDGPKGPDAQFGPGLNQGFKPQFGARFGSPFGNANAPLAARIGRTAIVVAVMAGLLCVAALALWFALALVPVVLAASAVAWVAYRIQLWRMRR
jgi:hypothetical protein